MMGITLSDRKKATRIREQTKVEDILTTSTTPAAAISLKDDPVVPLSLHSQTLFRGRPPLPHTQGIQEALPKEEIIRGWNVLHAKEAERDLDIMPLLDLPLSFSVRRRVETGEENRNVEKALIEFFLGESTQRNIFIFYDPHLYSDMAAAVGSCFQRKAEVTVLACDEVLARLEKILKSFNQLESLRNIFVFCRSDLTRMIFQQIFDKYLESAQTHWFVVIRENITRSIIERLREGTQVSFAIKTKDFSYQLMNSYINIRNQVELRFIGWWSWEAGLGAKSSLEAPLVKPLSEVYSDFGGRELKSTVINNWPFWVLEFPPDGSVRPVSGLDFHVLTDISEKLNFTFRMVMTPDKVWGGVLRNGSVTGMVGAVHYHSVHMAINELTLTDKREEAVDFTYPYFHESTTLISPAPKKSLKTYAVFASFTYEVWILLVSVMLVAGPILWLILWIRRVSFGEIDGKWQSLDDISFTLFKTMVMQVAYFPPPSIPVRLFFTGWYFFCLLVISLYSDVMISHLAIPSYEKPIDSLWDLLDAIEHRGYMTVISCGSNNEFLFSNTDQKIYKDIWTRFDRERGCILTWDEGMDKVTTGKFALVNNRMGAEVRANLRGRERFHFARNEFYPHGYSIACPNGSPYKDVFQRVLQLLMWSGLVQKYTSDELMKARKPSTHGEKGPEPISITHLQACFYLLLAGYLTSTVSLVVERCLRLYRSSSETDLN
ncbi:glutamate receptor ionotropic, delta-2-like [Palaemon carinicauda]|uniref:glutamate receptor ionotropic, delta-2-like n=1 Tax=Palaemon carinicauda TaxID=392227 RepID=UPI0035B687DB